MNRGRAWPPIVGGAIRLAAIGVIALIISCSYGTIKFFDLLKNEYDARNTVIARIEREIVAEQRWKCEIAYPLDKEKCE